MLIVNIEGPELSTIANVRRVDGAKDRVHVHDADGVSETFRYADGYRVIVLTGTGEVIAGYGPGEDEDEPLSLEQAGALFDHLTRPDPILAVKWTEAAPRADEETASVPAYLRPRTQEGFPPRCD